MRNLLHSTATSTTQLLQRSCVQHQRQNPLPQCQSCDRRRAAAADAPSLASAKPTLAAVAANSAAGTGLRVTAAATAPDSSSEMRGAAAALCRGQQQPKALRFRQRLRRHGAAEFAIDDALLSPDFALPEGSHVTWGV